MSRARRRHDDFAPFIVPEEPSFSTPTISIVCWRIRLTVVSPAYEDVYLTTKLVVSDDYDMRSGRRSADLFVMAIVHSPDVCLPSFDIRSTRLFTR